MWINDRSLFNQLQPNIEQGHPDAKLWRRKINDYDKLAMILGSDVATGQFAKPATVAPNCQFREGYTAGHNPF